MKRPDITPGPWTLGNTEPLLVETETWFIANTCAHVGEGSSCANAKAIAAVPELLEALEQCLLFVTATPHDPAFHARITSALTKAGYDFNP